MFVRRTGVVGLAAVLAALAGTGAAVALGSGGGGVIKVCANKHSGILRLRPRKGCAKSEKLISWNQQGVPGINGTNGTNGTNGMQGPPGPFPTTLPSGKTLTGTYFITLEATTSGQEASTQISFQFPLASAPTPHFIPAGTTPPSGCTGGSAAAPTAARGNLCIFEGAGFHDQNQGECTVDGSTVCPGASTTGAGVYIFSTGAARVQSIGSWAVTAP